MRSLYIIVFVLVLCNIALTGSASFTKHLQWDGAWMTDTVDTVANGSSLAVDSLSKDSLAVDTLAKDSLAVDSLSKDSLAVDTLSKDSLAVDSIARFVVQPKKRVYVYFKEKPEPDADQKKIEGFISLYKKNISNKTAEGYAAAYLPWKGAFEGCNRRTLDMYMDGIGIILNLVRKDTLEHKYDKLTERRDQMMELYDLAVDNLDDLNAQIDRKRTSDTLSVAKLRAAQVRKYRDCWILDSIFNGHDVRYNDCSENSIKHWRDTIFLSDTIDLNRVYPWLDEIVHSNDNNFASLGGYAYYALFAKAAYRKYAPLINQLQKTDKNYLTKYIKPEVDSLEVYTKNKYEDYYAWFMEVILDSDNPKIDDYIKNTDDTRDAVYDNFSGLQEAFVDGGDFEKLEQIYTERYLATGFTEELVKQILASGLRNNPESEMYFNALYDKYSKEPTYDLTKNLAYRALKLKKNDVALKAYDSLFKMSEFQNEDMHEQTFLYCLAAQLMIQAGQRTKILPYIEAALKVNPESSDAYMLYATYFGGLKVKDKLPIYCLCYEYSHKALNLCAKNEGNQVIYSKESISKQIGSYYNILKESFSVEIFMRRDSGSKLSPIKIGGRSFTPTLPNIQ